MIDQNFCIRDLLNMVLRGDPGGDLSFTGPSVVQEKAKIILANSQMPNCRRRRRGLCLFGMILLLYGLAIGDAGVVTTLFVTTPVLILPLLWITTGIRPPLMALLLP